MRLACRPTTLVRLVHCVLVIALAIAYPTFAQEASDAGIAILQSGQVEFDARLFDRKSNARSEQFEITPFTGTRITCELDRREVNQNGVTFLGHVSGEPHSLVSISQSTVGIIGYIRSTKFGTIDIRPGATGKTFARQLDVAHLATCPMNETARNPIPRGAIPTSDCDDGSVIDVLVVYTTDAKTAAGGQAAIEALINLAVSDANNAFANSLINTSLNLVHTEEIAYVETGNWTIDGPRLIDPNDGFLDVAHTLRDQYGADCVSLWVNSLNTGGIGYFPDASFQGIGASGLSMLRLDNAPLLTFAHEIGHNFFCAHDRPNAPDPPFAEYSYGYVEPGSQWRTIMATSATPTVIPHFANPNVNWTGTNPGPTGIAEGQPLPSDNARTINELRTVVANFRATSVPGLGSTLYVNAAAIPGGDGQSWATAIGDLQEALCMAKGSAGTVQQVWVAAGVYTPDGGSGDRSATFKLIDGVSILGGFDGTEALESQRDPSANETILSGDIGIALNASDNSYHVVTASLNSAAAILDGFTIRDGHADGTGPDHGGGGAIIDGGGDPQFVDCKFENNQAANRGGGMMNTNGSSPTLIGCTFENNVVTGSSWPGGGGGMHNSSSSNPTLTACTFRANSTALGSGLANYFGSSPVLNGCVFADNTGAGSSEGGGLYGYSFCAPTLTDCIFEGNSASIGGAIAGYFSSAPNLDRCIIRGNAATGDGGGIYLYVSSNGLMTNCLLAGNTGAYGAAMINLFDSHANIINCTIVGNTGTSGSGGIFNYQSDPVIANSILWRNSAGGTFNESAQIDNNNGFPTIHHSTVEGWTGALGGASNNGTDPMFTDADGPDNTYGTEDDNGRLSAASPSVNTGDNSAIPSGITFDLDQSPRIANTTVDRGAYEYAPLPGDFDNDGDIDIADYAELADCLSGPDTTPSPTPPTTVQQCLSVFDFDADEDIDLQDAASFTNAFTP